MNITAYGVYLTESEQLRSEATIDFIVPLELMSRWERCGLIADFLSKYKSFSFMGQPKAEMLLSTIINELLENAIKFSVDKNKMVNLSIKDFKHTVSIEAVNISDEEQVAKLKQYIHILKSENTDVLFFKMLERGASQNISYSGIGLLTLIKDYHANLGLKIVPKFEKDKFYEIYTKVVVPAESLK